MRLCITGVPGWFTSAFLDMLEKEPLAGIDDVVALIQNSEASTSSVADFPGVSTLRAFDLASPASFGGLFEDASLVLHAAGVIHVRHPDDWRRVNTDGTIALAKEAKIAGVRRFVFLSSNAAGGVTSDPAVPLTEDMRSQPMSLYGMSKLRAERSLLAMHEAGTFEVVILRPSMFYGPPVPQRHVDIYKRIQSGRMPLIGSGEYRRSVTNIDNLVQAGRLALTNPRAAGNVYYIVDKDVYTTRSIVEAMADALGTSPRFMRLPAFISPLAYGVDKLLEHAGWYVPSIHLVGEATWHVPISSEKAERELGYRPRGTLADGMRRAVSWCRENGRL